MRYFLIVCAILGPSIILGGMFYLYITKPRKIKQTENFLGINSLKNVIKNQNDYPLLKPRKKSRAEKRKSEMIKKFWPLPTDKTNEDGKSKKA